MELRRLRYFISVAEEENVSRAAVMLHVSQPAFNVRSEKSFLVELRG